MTSPRVIELPRRLEPVVRDTFLGGDHAEARPTARIATVVALRPRDVLRPAGELTPPAAA